MLTLLFSIILSTIFIGARAFPQGPPSYIGAGHSENATPTMMHWPSWTTGSVTKSTAATATGTIPTTVSTSSTGSETYSDGTTTSLASCAASMNGTVPSSLGWTFDGTIRRYYVAAEEVEWDYVPTGWDNWLGVSGYELPSINHILTLRDLGSNQRFHSRQTSKHSPVRHRVHQSSLQRLHRCDVYTAH
jgi:hypothetical protein